MLQRLSVTNYALIQELNIEFGAGLTIITGETGAGKSILLGAMHMLLGERVESSVLRDPLKKCIVEGTFHISDYDLKGFFEENELDLENTCLLRREINPAGKSRAFINDTPVNLGQLKELGSQLIDIHSQHDTLLLGSSRFQFQLLDGPAENNKPLVVYRQLFVKWKNLIREIEILSTQERKLAEEQDYLLFQFNELNDAKLESGEAEKAEEEFKTLSHAAEIRQQLDAAINLMEAENGGVLGNFRLFLNHLHLAAKFSATTNQLFARSNSLYIELKDILSEAENQQGEMEADPARLENLSARLDLLNHLLHKHRLQNVNELIELRDRIDEKLQIAGTAGEKLVELTAALEKLETELKKAADVISDRRKKIAPVISREAAVILKNLGMPKSKLSIEVGSRGTADLSGMDSIKILFSANSGELQDLNKVASGGELSRLMLAMKKIISGSVALPTIIFDEIDTGVSGAVADSMGEVMKEMSSGMQVVAITHLPQIASKGNDHLKVSKTTIGPVVSTVIKRLKGPERVSEIAYLLSGKNLSDAAISNAKTLLGMTDA